MVFHVWMYHHLRNQPLTNVYMGFVEFEFLLTGLLLELCFFFSFHCLFTNTHPPPPPIWCFLVTQSHCTSFSFSLFSEMFFWLLSLVLSFWNFSFHALIFFELRTKVLLEKISPLWYKCELLTLFSNPRGEEKEAVRIPFLIRNKRLLLAGSLVKISLFWALHSHVNNNEWRFHPPTPHCSSCPLPFLSNLGTQETAEHVLNSTLGSHRSISLDSSYPLVVLFLCLTWRDA